MFTHRRVARHEHSFSVTPPNFPKVKKAFRALPWKRSERMVESVEKHGGSIKGIVGNNR